MAEASTDLDRAYNDLREINSGIAALSGRTIGEKTIRKKISMDDSDEIQETVSRKRLLVQAPDSDDGPSTRRRVIVYNEPEPRETKRGRFEEERGGFERRRFIAASGAPAPAPRRVLQSSVVLPIETKSREETISKLKKTEKKEDAVRNRRLFGNLILGTLDKFQKDAKTVAPTADVQVKKQLEVERRLEMSKKEETERVSRQKNDLLSKKREKEMEILRLKRVKAIEYNAQEKEKHFRRLQQFIQTQSKPPLFYLPGKHTLRTLELLKESSKNIEVLVDKCREEAERELKGDDDDEDDLINNHSVASRVVVGGSVSNGSGKAQEKVESDENADEQKEGSVEKQES